MRVQRVIRGLTMAKPVVEVLPFEVRDRIVHDEPARLLLGDDPFAIPFEFVDLGPALAGKLVPEIHRLVRYGCSFVSLRCLLRVLVNETFSGRT